ncbi:hypothetical protein DT23_12040 [Thioclava indica]|uniref:Uncharacterized protein n=1 Tax=Thioclava indica TaxID=1353528 RepID=A0A074KGV5_9RHOB|nr:hypothetical protein DT23_12040 [Thioclava indica]
MFAKRERGAQRAHRDATLCTQVMPRKIDG